MSFDQRPAQTKLRVVSPAATPAPAADATPAAGASAADAPQLGLPWSFVIGAILGGVAAAVGVRAAGVDVVALLSPPSTQAVAAPAAPGDDFDPR